MGGDGTLVSRSRTQHLNVRSLEPGGGSQASVCIRINPIADYSGDGQAPTPEPRFRRNEYLRGSALFSGTFGNCEQGYTGHTLINAEAWKET